MITNKDHKEALEHLQREISILKARDADQVDHIKDLKGQLNTSLGAGHAGSLTISRVFGDKDYVRITIRDNSAKTTFVEAKISLKEYGNAATGLSERPVVFTTRGLDKIGKVGEVDILHFKMPEHTSNSMTDVAIAKAETLCTDGWVAETSYNSQNSFYNKTNRDGLHEQWARTTIRRWVEK